ncbi:DUF4175 family protein [Pararhodospirillum photometricum]|uniref:DUF4175 family protein n=1 Tax=Pararhodospirillum photometricum TaxID=1084 RepID=UPI0002DC3BE7|nr:DUF4175 family protein [Pararhodospirillum photometricum]
MSSPRPPPRRPSGPRSFWEGTRRWLLLSRLFLVWERLCAAFWPLASVLGGLLALALAGLPAWMPAWGHALVLMIGVALILATTGAGLRRFRWPSPHEARRRLEAGATERVLTAATDRLALGDADPLTRALWARHRRRARAAAARLRPRPPDPVVAARDPRALRFIPVLLLVVGAVLGAGDPGSRLLAFLSPRLGNGEGRPIARVWLTGPAWGCQRRPRTRWWTVCEPCGPPWPMER